MIKKIVTYDIHAKENPKVLTQMTRKVTDFDSKEVKDCIQDLNDTLDELIRVEGNKRGVIGLSATQIGVDLAISAVTIGENRYFFINPELETERGKDRLFRIGCFSLYEYRAMVRYNDDVTISYDDPKGRRCHLDLKGDHSCVVQHEMDHLVGDLLFERLENKENDLFVPRESLYKDGKIPFENNGLIFELRRKLGMNKVQSGPVFYSSLFNDYTDYKAFADQQAAEKKDFLSLIETYAKGKILEVGNGTSVLAVALNKKGYDLTSCQSDPDMLELGRSINAQNGTSVNYCLAGFDWLPFEDKSFSLLFSYEVLETFDDGKLEKALDECVRVAEKTVILVPTIRIASNALRGNEILRSAHFWRKAINKNHHLIKEILSEDGFAYFVIG